MENFVVQGPCALSGEVQVSSAKNAVLPLLAAALLCPGVCTICDAPHLTDVATFLDIFDDLGVAHTQNGRAISIDARTIGAHTLHDVYAKKMRASVLVLGPLLGRCGQACAALPGGCAIGARPIDLHLAGFEKMGARIHIQGGLVRAQAPHGLTGADICLDFPSVGATENLLMAAAVARGKTIIDNAAREPEIVDLAKFLRTMGAKIRGAGTDTIQVEGVAPENLTGASYTPMPDRMEAATYMIAAAATGGDVLVRGAQTGCLRAVCAKLMQTGAQVIRTPGGIRVRAGQRLIAADVRTMQFPGFPTDAQAPMMALLCGAQGTSVVTETIFENRFRHVPELIRLGAQIRVDNATAIVRGAHPLTGARVTATDLRAGAALLIAACCARGETVIDQAGHILRGYENAAEKWQALGAQVQLIHL